MIPTGVPSERPPARGGLDRDDAELLILRREQHAIGQLVVPGYLASIVDRAEQSTMPLQARVRVFAR